MELVARRWVRCGVATLIAFARLARAQTAPSDFDIAAQDAASALTEFGEQSHLQLVFDFDAVQGVATRAVAGRLRVVDALGRLLMGTGLTYEIINDHTISILRDAEVRDGGATVARASPRPAGPDVDPYAEDMRSRHAAAPATANTTVDEIIVT